MTHSDCASAGQCKLDGVEKSNRAVGFLTKHKSMLFSCVVLCIVLKYGSTGCFYNELQRIIITVLKNIFILLVFERELD